MKGNISGLVLYFFRLGKYFLELKLLIE